ncbi:MAG TPA: DUF2652 domain-containing protein [Myxococcales bacterium]|nr:DUF2652 domain-containing protein [Myxococcales bacterium]
MSEANTLLVIADISGYTQFMKRTALSHAQDVVARLLEAVIDSASPAFKVAKLEGDAVFLYAPSAGEMGDLAARLGGMRRSFGVRQQRFSINRVCECEGCVGAAGLKLKFVSHIGEVAFQKVKRYQELAGFDVIVVHRLLKNKVPLSEYVLMTEAVARHLTPDLASRAKAHVEDLEGVGPTELRYLDIADVTDLALPAATSSTWGKIRTTVGTLMRTWPVMLGLRRPADDFSHVHLAPAGTAADVA